MPKLSPTTLANLLAAVLAVAGHFAGVIPLEYQPIFGGAVAFANGVKIYLDRRAAAAANVVEAAKAAESEVKRA